MKIYILYEIYGKTVAYVYEDREEAEAAEAYFYRSNKFEFMIIERDVIKRNKMVRVTQEAE